jgi:hypothetical protein
VTQTLTTDGQAGTAAPVRVVYLLGLPHSGTTLLCNLLGEHDGCVSVGELCFFYRRWLSADSRCGCGRPLRECPFWRRVVAHGALDGVDVHSVAATIHRLIVARHLAKALVWRAGRRGDGGQIDRCREALRRLYQALGDATDRQVVIDSSKSPALALALEDLPGIELRLIHVVRDSRGNANSRPWLGSRAEDLPLHSKLLLWDMWHLFVELRWRREARYLRVRYEDLIAAPARTLERILAFAGAAPHGSPLRSEDLAALRPHHTVAGNQNRFRTGEVRLRLDTRWRRELAPGDRALAMALTAPLLLRHGYLSRRGPGPGRAWSRVRARSQRGSSTASPVPAASVRR